MVIFLNIICRICLSKPVYLKIRQGAFTGTNGDKNLWHHIDGLVQERPVCYLCNRNSSANKMSSLYWISPQNFGRNDTKCDCMFFLVQNNSWHSGLIIPLHNAVVGGILVSLCPSVRLYFFLSVRQKVCRVYNFKIGIFGNFLKFVTLTLSSFDLVSDVNQYYG